MAVNEKHEFTFTCDDCGEEYTMLTNELPEGWIAIVRNASINVEKTDFYCDRSHRILERTLRDYKASNAHIQTVLCSTCANDLYNMFAMECH